MGGEGRWLTARQEERLDVDRETDRCQKEVTRFSEQHGDPAPAGPPVNGFGLDIVYELDGQTALPVSLTTMCLITFHCGLFANSCSASGPFILSPPPAADSHLPEPASRYPCDLTTVPRRITFLIYLQQNLTIVIMYIYWLATLNYKSRNYEVMCPPIERTG